MQLYLLTEYGVLPYIAYCQMEETTMKRDQYGWQRFQALNAMEEGAFADWLNKVDAYSDYEWRRNYPLHSWRYMFDLGMSPRLAISRVANSGGVSVN